MSCLKILHGQVSISILLILCFKCFLPYFKILIKQYLKFGLSKKHTKFEKIFLMVLTNQPIYLVNVKTMRKIFSNYVSFSKSLNFKKLFQSIQFYPGVAIIIIQCKMNSSEIIPTHFANFASTFFSSQSSSVLLFEFELPSDSKCFSKLSSGHPMLASRAMNSGSVLLLETCS